MKRSGLLSMIFPVLFVAVTVIMSGIILLSYTDSREEVMNDLKSTSSFLNSFYEISFYERELGLRALGERMLAFSGPRKDSLRLEVAMNAINTHSEFMAIGLVDTAGQIITFTGRLEQKNLPNLSKSEQTRRSFLEAKMAKGIILGEVYYFDEVAEWILPLRVPIRDSNGSLIGVNTSAISLDRLHSELQSFKLNPKFIVHLVNNTFGTTQMIYPMEKSRYPEYLRKSADIYTDSSLSSSRDNYLFFEAFSKVDENQVLSVSTPINKYDHKVVVSVPSGYVWMIFREKFIFLISIYFIFILVLFLLYWFFRHSEKRHDVILAEEQEFSDRLLNSGGTLVAGFNLNGQCTFRNTPFNQVFGQLFEQQNVSNCWGILFEGVEIRGVRKALKSGELFRHVQDYAPSQSNLRTITWNFVLVSNKSKGDEVFCVGLDITAVREKEMALKERDANLQSIFENTNNIIGLFDKELNLIEFNHSFAEYALQTDNLVLYKGMRVLDKMNRPQAESFGKFLGQALEGRRISEVVEYPSSVGVFYFLLTYNPIQVGDTITGVSMFVQDITELKSVQNQLKEYTENLERIVDERTQEIARTNKDLLATNSKLKKALDDLKNTQEQLIRTEKMASLGILSAGVGHEINNPLNFIKGGVNALTEVLAQIPQDLREEIVPLISYINEGVSRASAIVKSLSEFSRTGSKLDEDCLITEIIDNCLVILHNKMKRRIEVIQNITPGIFVVKGNAGQLHQVFLNILSNAEQAIPDQGKIEISVRREQNMIRIAIADSGTGISEENLGRISDPFFTTKPPGEGTGLGLSIAYRIIEEHKGSIGVTSILGNGTEFIILLPSKS